MQGLPIELGGFKGRTNKLVDGCYSWWVGGCVVLAETLLGVATHPDAPAEVHSEEAGKDGEKSWEDIDGETHLVNSSSIYADWHAVHTDSLFDRRALQEYLLCAGQHSAGGLRDKPPK